MEIRLLGPVEVRDDGVLLDVGSAKPRLVLAALAVTPGEVVPTDVLVDRVWGDDPPSRPMATLYPYLSQLRRALEPAGVRIVRRGGGYVCEIAADAVDVAGFRDRIANARTSDVDEAAGLLREALALWRGPPLTGLTGDWADRLRDTLERERLAAWLLLAEHRFRHGELATLADELQAVADEYPLSEPLAGYTIRALALADRRAEALAHYADVRARLVDQLGEEPGAELRDLHLAVLRRSSDLESRTPRPGSQVPRQLPPDVGGFCGRDEELAELDVLHQGPPRTGSTVVISTVTGTGGVGKTALAVHWAHRHADDFPDGQLWIDLRGFDSEQPVDPAAALAGFLRALGVEGPAVPSDLAERTAMFRTLVADRRMLVGLDNAGDADQVRPLLPGSPSCVAIVTSRDSLAGLVARDGARRVDLDALPDPEAVALLETLIGGRASDDPSATAAVAVACARLPLALRIAAEHAVARPSRPLSELAADLADAQRRLDLLAADSDPRTAVRAVFSWSYQTLDPAIARTFRLLGLHPGADLDRYAVAALADLPIAVAGRSLDTLSRAHLVHEPAPGRYAMHDLLHAWAAERADADDTETERTAALDRLFHYYRHTAASAVYRYAPKLRGQLPPTTEPGTPIPAFDDRQQATAWLDAERANLLATAVHAADHGSAQHTDDLSGILYLYLRTAGHDHEAEGLHELAARVACRADRARAMTRLGYTQVRLGRQAEAATTLERALASSQDAGDPADEARVLMGLGRLYEHMGRLVDAIECTRGALDIARDLGDRGREATARINLGSSLLLLGRYDEALDHLATALVITRENEDLHDECVVRGNLAEISRRLGDDGEALEQLERVLSIARDVRFREGETKALSGLGTVLAQAGRHREALAHHREAIAIAREIGLRKLEIEALNDLGNTLRRHGQVRQALECHDEALGLAGADAESFQLARTHEGLGDDHRDLDDHDLATEHWRQALAIYDRMGAPEANDVRARLTPDEPTHDHS